MDQRQLAEHGIPARRDVQQDSPAIHAILLFSNETAKRQTIGQFDGAVMPDMQSCRDLVNGWRGAVRDTFQRE